MLAYDVLSNRFLKQMEKEYGKQRSLQYLNKIMQIMNKAGEDWDNCKTIDDNMSKLIGDLTQMIVTDVVLNSKIKNLKLDSKYDAMLFVEMVQIFLDSKGISFGNATQNLYRLSWEAENYFKGLSELDAQERANFDKLPDDVKARNTADSVAPDLPGWNAHINEMNQKQRNDYENAIKGLFAYSQIPMKDLEILLMKTA